MPLQLSLDSERVVAALLTAVVLTILAIAVVALLQVGRSAGAIWARRRCSLLAAGESTYVGRFGRMGPELFVVGAGVRRLSPAPGRNPTSSVREAGAVGPALAAPMLAEILGRRPSRQLVWAFVEEQVADLPRDGFLLPTADVIAWLDARHAGEPEPRERAGEAIAAPR